MADRSFLRRALWIALVSVVVLSAAGVFRHGLWTPDEPREAEVGREMLLSRFSAMPTLSGAPFVEKPPLFAWVTGAAYSVFGVNDWAGRIPSALFAVGSSIVAYLLGRRAGGRLAGVLSALVLATMWQFEDASDKVSLDSALTFFVACGHLAFLHLRDRNGARLYAAVGLCAGLAFLTKGFIGPALMCAPPFLAAAAMGDWKFVKRALVPAALASVVGVAAFGLPWVFALAHTPGGGWDKVKECLWTNTVGRSVTLDEASFGAHAHGPFYYLTAWLSVTAPWALTLPAVLQSGAAKRRRRGAMFLGLIFVAGLVLLSVPQGKREIYLLPLMPAASVVIGVWLSRVGSRSGGRWDRATLTVLTGLAAVVAVVVVVVAALATFGVGTSALAKVGDVGASADEMAGVFLRSVVVPALVFAVAALLIVRRIRAPEGRAVFRAVASVVLVFLVYDAAVRPAFDPTRNMSAGAKEIASLVPGDGPILALKPDETLRSIVPFYTGRMIDTAVKAPDALKRIDAGATHLVVMDKYEERITPALRARLVLVKGVRINSTRAANVYEVRAP